MRVQSTPERIRFALSGAILILSCAPPHPATVTPPRRGPDAQPTAEEPRPAPVVPAQQDTVSPVMPAAPGALHAASAAAAWSQRAPLPEPRTEVSATTDGRFVYLAGGFGPPAEGERATAPRTLWRYDPQADAWLALTELPAGVHHAPFQHHDGRLFILGGFGGTSFDPVADVRIYDLASGRWSDGAPMPTPRGAAGWALLDGRIHVIGGNATADGVVHDHSGERATADGSVNVHEAYDPATDQWTRLAPMPTPRNHLGVAALNGRLHAVLGRADGNFTMTTHEIYDPTTDRWSAGPDVPTGRSGVAVVTQDGWLYAFGGERLDEPNRRTFDDAERFDPRTNQWQRLSPMPTARHGLGAAAVRGAIYVISGGPGPAFTFGTVNERVAVERRDPGSAAR